MAERRRSNSSEMPFNLLSPYLFVLFNVNCSISVIQEARFFHERCEAKRAKLADDEREAEKEADQVDLSEEFRRIEAERCDEKLSLLSLPADLKQMLRYNQNKPLQLVLFLCHLILLVLIVFKTLVYSSYSTERDSQTREFVEPVLRFVESKLFVVDFVYVFDRTGLCNRLVGLNFIQYLMLRLWCFRRLLKVAKMNRDRYKKLNIVDSYFCYLMNLRASERDWSTLAQKAKELQTISEGPLSLTEARRSALENLHNLDRLYFCNQIVFTRSYLGTGIHLREGAAEETEHADRTGRLQRCSTGAFSLSQPNKRHFCPRPAHPQHACHLATISRIFFIGSYGTWAAAVLIQVVFTYIGLHDVDEAYTSPTDWRLLLERALKFRSMLLITQMSVQILVFVANYWDLGVIGLVSILCYSRSSRVTQLLDHQLRLHRAYLSRYKLQLDREPNLNMTFARCRRLRSNSRSLFNEILEVHERSDMVQLFCKPIDDLSGQVAHLLDLVEVLEAEMRDLRAYFTPLLNLYLVIGTISFAATSLLVSKWTSYVELVGASLSVSVAIGPMLISLYAGAVHEQVLRKIYLRLQWLMANELCLLEVSVVRRMQRICAHLATLENRAVVVFGNFPLNFGSLTSILGWIITGNLLIQRFVI